MENMMLRGKPENFRRRPRSPYLVTPKPPPDGCQHSPRYEVCKYAAPFAWKYREYTPNQIYTEWIPRLSQDVISAFQSFIRPKKSRCLWLEGTTTAEEKSNILSSAKGSGIPTVTKWCKKGATMTIVYDLISQFATLLPENFARGPALSEQNLKDIHKSIDVALEVLDALLDLAPKALLCFINNLEEVETDDTVEELGRLVDVLLRKREGKRFKLLMLTSENSRVLAERLDALHHLKVNLILEWE
ncbi:uncharacterized protein GGS25DRAFT_520655 [Hypoxylon fragiforme]|uniref:uncharacterized protein n=1 Tax=Hypoxylon fragiforme TaxID=63214 RepID=UPI0020C6C159|nr:uncharacterized protein GGS25DRAFT_520655 [Hypoxylon fragiforme]KAI2609849.1 hypothetical protein GGS25DRAFT_520655 [Hypoxylon fragiforme]